LDGARNNSGDARDESVESMRMRMRVRKIGDNM
jgi:hypothetical protein